MRQAGLCIAALGVTVRFCRVSRVRVGRSGWRSVVAGAGRGPGRAAVSAGRRVSGTGRPCAD
jgi:hypothetical protein